MLAADSVTQIVQQIKQHNGLQDILDNIDSMAALIQ